MQPMQAMRHQQIVRRTHVSLRFLLLPASTIHRAGCFSLQAEVERVPLLETLRADEGQGLRGSVSADLLLGLYNIFNNTTRANPVAAASSGVGGASARAPKQTASQVNTIPLICRLCKMGQFGGGCSICT